MFSLIFIFSYPNIGYYSNCGLTDNKKIPGTDKTTTGDKP